MFKIKNIFKKKGKEKLGVVLGGGGLAGLTHIGVLKILEDNNISSDCIVGCSIGSIIGAYYSLNPDTKRLEEIVSKMNKWDLMRLIDLNNPKFSLIKGKKIKNFLEELLGDKSFSDTKIPLRIVATDLEKGEDVIFSKGKLIDAVMASISIPGIFPVVKLNKKILVDGGVTNPTPINIAKKMGFNKIIGVDLTKKNEVELKNPKIHQTILRSYEVLRNRIIKQEEYDEKSVLIIRPNVTNLELLKKSEISNFIKEGERVAKNNLDKIKKLVKK